MDHRDLTTNLSPEITFSLDTRLQMSGDVALVLRLYRRRDLVSTSTLMVCEREHLPESIRVCRSHLGKLGVAERATLPKPTRAVAPSSTAAA